MKYTWKKIMLFPQIIEMECHELDVFVAFLGEYLRN